MYNLMKQNNKNLKFCSQIIQCYCNYTHLGIPSMIILSSQVPTVTNTSCPFSTVVTHNTLQQQYTFLFTLTTFPSRRILSPTTLLFHLFHARISSRSSFLVLKKPQFSFLQKGKNFNWAMGIGTMSGVLMVVLLVMAMENAEAAEEVFSAKLMHRFSDEVTAVRVSRNGGEGSPQKWSSEYYRWLLGSDLQRQKMKLGPQFEYLFPSQGSTTFPLGNDFGWSDFSPLCLQLYVCVFVCV